MVFTWIPNIACEIKDGKAYLVNEFRKKMNCPGACHSCSSFQGVDLKDTGQEYYQSCCDIAQRNNADRPRSEKRAF